ncbi:MAG TPA: hypothetical protein VLI72_04385 [Methylibium sp.]|nr:hypothetical protein [Methylibium sp.]
MSLPTLLMPAVTERLLLLANHVLWAEPAAVERLRAHAGRRVQLAWQVEPGPWPSPPAPCLRVTAAGLFELVERDELEAGADLHLRIALAAPHRQLLQWLGGERPAVSVEGDAQLAADLAWLGQNLRWDLARDLAPLIGPGPAHELVRLGGEVAAGLRTLLQAAAGDRPSATPAASR